MSMSLGCKDTVFSGRRAIFYLPDLSGHGWGDELPHLFVGLQQETD